jgi:hypothetical protein
MRRQWTELGQAWMPARPHPLPQSEHERVLAAARLERHGRLTTLYLAGTPYEMGYQHGVLARELIHGFRREAYGYVTSLMQKAVRPAPPSWLARPLLFYQAAAYWPTVAPEYAQEMEGIADGAGVHPIEVLVSTAIWEMYLVSGCSEFVAAGPMTAGGSMLHGYNYDLMHPDHALIQPYLAALFYRPSQDLPFFTVNTVGSIGANAGMNEAGISIAWDNTYLRDDQLTHDVTRPVVPFILTLRRLLQTARNLEEGVAVLTRSLPRPLADIVIVGSAAEGRAVAVETAGHVYAVREMEENAVWSTNRFHSPELAPYDRGGDGRGLPEVEAAQRLPRYTAYRQLFTAHRGRLSPEVAAAFLRDPYPHEAEGFQYPNSAPRTTICRDITSWSLVMQPGTGRLWISDTEMPAPQGRFFAFDLPGWQRVPDQDLPPTGYQATLRCAQRFLTGDWQGARTALAEALAVDGATAPLLLMQAVLHGLAGEEEAAQEVLRQVEARWDGTPASALACAWQDAVDAPSMPSMPFPSAIRALVHLLPACTWEERAIPARS